MSEHGLTAPASLGLREGEVVRVEDDGIVIVMLGSGQEEFVCERLDAGALTPWLAPKDRVLVWIPDAPADRGVVIGRIGLTHASAADTLLLEAKHSLTLRVGEGSITIREDGKILIKGKDLVSHAQRMNRIKGGAVSIN